MNPSFEQPNTSSHEREDRISAPEAIKQAEEAVAGLLSEMKAETQRRLQEDPVVHLKGKDWNLDEVSEAYKSVARLQKEQDIIEEKLNEVVEKNRAAEPSTSEEAITNFGAQILSWTRDTKQKQAALKAQEIAFKDKHPKLSEQVFGRMET